MGVLLAFPVSIHAPVKVRLGGAVFSGAFCLFQFTHL